MAKSSGLGDLLLVGGNNLSGDIGAVNNISCPRAVYDVTGISSSAHERVLGTADPQIDFTAYFNEAAGAAHLVLSALPTGNINVLYCRGQSIGSKAAFLVAKQVNYDPSRPTDGSLSFGVQALGSNTEALEWGETLTAGVDTIASAGSEASKDDGADTTAGFAAVLHVVDIDSGTPTVVIEDSADDAAWATLVSFAAVADGAEPTSERKETGDNSDRYLRITTTGTFTNLDLVVAYRRGLSVDDDPYA